MNAAADKTVKKVYKYNNVVQAVCKPSVKSAIEIEAERTGASISEVAARILEAHFKTPQRVSKNSY